MKHKVLLTQRFNEGQIERLRAVSPDLEIVQKSVREEWDAMDTGTLFQGDEEILYGFMPPRDLSIVPRLKWIQLHSAGINHIQSHPILNSNVQITTCSGVHAVAIGEFSIAMMLALARRIPRMVRMQDSDGWPKDRWRTFMSVELRGKTLGILGYGSIGRETARIAKHGFAMRVLAFSRSGERADRGYSEPGVGDAEGKLPDAWFDRDHLPALLSASDFLLLALPLTPQTHRLVGAAELRLMRPTAFIVNIARGDIIDEAALVQALRENWIAGAGLDVFAEEPLPASSELWQLKNAILAPHVSSATPHYDDRAVALFAENLRRYLRGDPLLNLVDRQRGY